VAALRYLQREGHPGAMRAEYVVGPYVGTAFYLAAIVSFLHANGISELEEIAELRYREGEWPGFLQIRTRSGKTLRAEKFYYNYLIPFYITRSSLLSVDFMNELTDVSVGDAWHPNYENRGGGYSVVLARSEKGQQLLERMQAAHLLELDSTSAEAVLAMHGHMLDFKKRGAFIRIQWRRKLGLQAPEYHYEPERIPAARYLVEAIIVGIFAIGRTRPARKLVEIIPLDIIGPIFNFLRLSWKNVSKPTKRQGLGSTSYRVNWANHE
jgi:coenzyme F420 hydrogenase subunit beta